MYGAYDILLDYMDVITKLSEKEILALEMEIPMTYELFCLCVDSCAQIGAYAIRERTFMRYPEYSIRWGDEREKELENVVVPDWIEERKEELLERIRNSIE